MLIIKTHPCNLQRTGASPTYVYTTWTSSGSPYYALGAMVKYQVGSLYYDYRCLRGHTASSSRNPTNYYYWSYVGPASTSGGYTYTTNVRQSNATTWASGSAVALGQAVYDNADFSDYMAAVAMTAQENGATNRPSEAILSSTASIAARWVRIGKANAWAWADYEIANRLSGYDANNALVNPVTFTIDAGTLAFAVNRIAFAGLANVETVTVKTYKGANLVETLTKSLSKTTTQSGAYLLSSAVLTSTGLAAGDAVTIEVSLSRQTTDLPLIVGAIVIGYGYRLASTDWDVETSQLNFSRRERDTTFGTVKFLARGSAKTIRATGFLDAAISSGDYLLSLLASLSGGPIYFDLNPDDTDYDRLRIFGICTRASSVIKAVDWESVSLELEGLVE